MLPDQPNFTCSQAEELFSDALENELTSGAKAAFTAHLESCSHCREGFADFKEAMGALGSYTPAPVPDEFLAEVNLAVQPSPVARRWPLILAWATTAAAAVVAIFALLHRPEPLRIEVPVEREVVKIKEVERIVEKEVPVEKRVEVAVPTPITVPLGKGTLEILRADKVIRLTAGDQVCLKPGDRIRTISPKPTLRLELDTRPLAYALRRSYKDMQRVADQTNRALMAIAMKPIPDPKPTRVALPARPAPLPPIILVREDSGALALETNGPDHRVIPELIALLDSDSTQVSAVVQGRLESIAERLLADHGIDAPRDISATVEPPGTFDQIKNIFAEKKKQPVETTPVDRWQRWWQQNQATIIGLTGNVH